jgi:hypothetical protein
MNAAPVRRRITREKHWTSSSQKRMISVQPAPQGERL